MRNLFRRAFYALVFVFVVNYTLLYPSEIRGTPKSLPQTVLTEVTEGILTKDGRLRYSGYSKKEVGHFDDGVMKSSWRYKKWDFYSVFLEDITLAVAVADLGYVANAFAMIYEHGKEGTTYETLIPPLSPVHMSANSTFGLTEYSTSSWQISFENEDKHHKRIKFRYVGVLEVDLKYAKTEEQEGIVTFLPMNPVGSHFFFSHKQYAYSVTGSVTYKDKTYRLTQTPALGAMDWGRGVWPYRSFWIWASASSWLADGRAFALNIGVFLGEHGQATDDFVTLGEKNVKLGVVTCPQANETDALIPYTFSTINPDPTAAYGSLSASFTPDQFYNKEVNMWVIHSQLKQIFGTFTGTVRYQGGEVKFEKVRGWIEKHLMRW